MKSKDSACLIKTASPEECQAACDYTYFCEARTFRADDGNCYFKQKTGWVSVLDFGYYSGFKNEGPYYGSDINFTGGDFLC